MNTQNFLSRSVPNHNEAIFNPSRLSLARRRRQFNKTDLADLTGVTVQTVLRWESGETVPAQEVVDVISSRLNFPKFFFYAPTIDEISADTASFRSLSKMTAGVREASLAAGTIGYTVMDWVEQKFNLPAVNIPDLRGIEPSAAARTLRETWGLGEMPIKNMVHLLEAKGVRVLSLAEETACMDAFAVWRLNKPYVFLNMMKTGERSRFDAAHELAHLVLHRHTGATGKEAEQEADSFASSFLMPQGDILAKLPYVSTVNQIISAKKRWGVSAMALTYRLHKLGLTSEWQNRTFCIQLTQMGYRTSEPDGIELERSSLWKQVMSYLLKQGITKPDLAAILSLPVYEIENLLFGLTNMLTYEGASSESVKSKANLSVVSSRT